MESENTNMFALLGRRYVDVISSHDFEHATDIMDIMNVLDKIIVSDGYVVDVYSAGAYWGSDYIPYVRLKKTDKLYRAIDSNKSLMELIRRGRRDEPNYSYPYSEDMRIVGTLNYRECKEIPNVFDNVSVTFDEMGVWQAFLLHISYSIMPSWWYGYNYQLHYIFNINDLTGVMADCSKYYIEKDGVAYVLPSVKINNDEATITYCYWSDCRGLVRDTVIVNRDWTFKLVDSEDLVKYSCGKIYQDCI